MPPQTVALIDKTGTIAVADLQAVAAAIEIQVNQHVQPFWNQPDTAVTVLAADAAIPAGVWPVYIGVNVPDGEEGVHQNANGQIFASVEMAEGDGWKITTSHEVCELVVDPTLLLGKTAKAITLVRGQIHDAPGQFNYLVEVCDPSENPDHGYTIGGVPVSDFYTPHFFDDSYTPGTQYSYTQAVKAPRRILQGGYLSWHDPVRDIYQQLVWIGTNTPIIRQVNWTPPAGAKTAMISREHVDRHTGTSRRLSHTHKDHPLFLRAAKERRK